jgi:hypothetical protein
MKLNIRVSNGAKPADFYGFISFWFSKDCLHFLAFPGLCNQQISNQDIARENRGQGMANAQIFHDN